MVWDENRKIRESRTNLFCSHLQKIFLAGPPMSVRNSAYSDMATLLLTNIPIYHFENMATLCIVGLYLCLKKKKTIVRLFFTERMTD